MVRKDVMSPADSGKYIAKLSQHVKIHDEGITKLCDEILKSIKDKKITIPEIGTSSIQPTKDHPRAADWVFVVDALNFCFWSKSKEQQWTVDGHTGYCALEAALFRAIKDGYDITNPEYYSKISREDLSKLFKGDTDAEIPLFQERIDVLHEVGSILLHKYNGTFETCVQEANKSAAKLLHIVVENFPCFRDEAMYKERRVSLYKRAQILVADLWNFFGGTGWGEFKDIDVITMFADYRVPQVLVYFGVLSYSDELMDKLRNDILLPSGSEEEVEIRGCSIHAVELLKKSLQQKIRDKEESIEVPNSSLIDYFLWCYRRKHAQEMEIVPYHKTLGIYY
ncbi:queuosine salvage protein [Zerene cesonia]|uniref:queuosine salvage protein n=1 Tax=Zerene cesonia TaxID=33412 RepID=UPI0018E560EF|nr:queuosine salvage protein [Zerene cesonia]